MEPQPRFVPPTNKFLSEPKAILSTPDLNPDTNSNEAPWNRPFIFSKNTRAIFDIPWSPTNN